MREWMPGAIHIDRGGGIPVQDSGPAVLVLHTTEGSRPASYNNSEPHFEVYLSPQGEIEVRQYVSLARTAKALYNAPGGVETNRRRGRIIQIEMVGFAEKAREVPEALIRGVAEVLAFVRTQFPGLMLEQPPVGFHGPEAGFIAHAKSHLRFDFPGWETFGGVCGHQHVPENDHWDPGAFPISKLFQFVREIEGDGGFLMGLSESQQREMYDWLGAQHGAIGRLEIAVSDSQGGMYRYVGETLGLVREIARIISESTPGARTQEIETRANRLSQELTEDLARRLADE